MISCCSHLIHSSNYRQSIELLRGHISRRSSTAPQPAPVAIGIGERLQYYMPYHRIEGERILCRSPS